MQRQLVHVVEITSHSLGIHGGEASGEGADIGGERMDTVYSSVNQDAHGHIYPTFGCKGRSKEGTVNRKPPRALS